MSVIFTDAEIRQLMMPRSVRRLQESGRHRTPRGSRKIESLREEIRVQEARNRELHNKRQALPGSQLIADADYWHDLLFRR